MNTTHSVKLCSDANDLMNDIERTKDFGDKLAKIRAMMENYFKLGKRHGTTLENRDY